jgi:hypothetical protein
MQIVSDMILIYFTIDYLQRMDLRKECLAALLSPCLYSDFFAIIKFLLAIALII